jgi:hypothetical protein
MRAVIVKLLFQPRADFLKPQMRVCLQAFRAHVNSRSAFFAHLAGERIGVRAGNAKAVVAYRFLRGMDVR